MRFLITYLEDDRPAGLLSIEDTNLVECRAQVESDGEVIIHYGRLYFNKSNLEELKTCREVLDKAIAHIEKKW